MKISYAKVPQEVTYNNGKQYDASSKQPQYPDPYQDIPVIINPFGHIKTLTFEGGVAPPGKNDVLIQHKGLYVKQITFISLDAIPEPIKDHLIEEVTNHPKSSK